MLYWHRYLGRREGDLPFKLAVGAWHIKPHKEACHVLYNARYMANVGWPFGDNVEHVWRHLRPWWAFQAYASPALRQDMLTMLVRENSYWDPG